MSFIRDTNLVKTKALPAAAATNYSDPLDLIESSPGIKMRDSQIEVVAPTLANLADTKTATFTLQDSADGSSFADIPELASITLTGAGGVGATTVTRRFKLPETVRRYVRLKQVVQAAGGDNTASSSTLSYIR